MIFLVTKVRVDEINDWSFSLFSREAVLRKNIKRLNCI